MIQVSPEQVLSEHSLDWSRLEMKGGGASEFWRALNSELQELARIRA